MNGSNFGSPKKSPPTSMNATSNWKLGHTISVAQEAKHLLNTITEPAPQQPIWSCTKRDLRYHWQLDLFKALNLPPFAGITEALYEVNAWSQESKTY